MKMRMMYILIVMVIAGMCMSPCIYAQDPAPDFTLKNLQGTEVTLSEVLAEQNVLLVFGTTWCPYCVQEISELNTLYDELDGNGLTILSVNVKEKMGKVQRFAEKKGIKYEVLLDSKGDVAREYGVRGIPANFFIDREGILQYESSGHFDTEEIRALAQK
ncbi:peroxiredoxin family protein [Candidatus Omnitrophota bacterium]